EGSNSVSVLSSPQFLVQTVAETQAGDPFAVTVTVRNALGQVVTAFAGTVTLRTSDPQALPLASYTFTAADKGSHSFDGLVLTTAGYQGLGVETSSPYSLAGATS